MALQISLDQTQTKDGNKYPSAYLRIYSVELKNAEIIITMEAYANEFTGEYARDTRNTKQQEGEMVQILLPQSIIPATKHVVPMADVFRLATVKSMNKLKNACYLWLKANKYEDTIDILED